MSAWRAIFLHELRLRASMPVVALALGIVGTLVARWTLDASDAPFTALAVSAVVTLIVALMTGATALGGYLGTGRLSFYFVRPVSWWEAWSSRFAACLVLTFGCALISLLPWLIVRPTGPGAASFGDSAPWSGLAATALLAIVLAGAAAVTRHAPMTTRLLHVGLFGLLVLAGAAALDTLRYGTWAVAGRHGEAVLLWPIALAVLAASAVQARAGRADARRGHLETAVALWGALALTLGLCVVVGRVVTRATPAALTRFDWAAREGDWVAVGGPVYGSKYSAAFLVEPRSGRFLRIGAADRVGSFALSPNGKLGLVQRAEPFGTRGDGAHDSSKGWTALVVEGLSDANPRTSREFGIHVRQQHAYLTDSGCVFLWQSSGPLIWHCPGRSAELSHVESQNHGYHAVAQAGDGTVHALLDMNCVYVLRLAEVRPPRSADAARQCVQLSRSDDVGARGHDDFLCEDSTATFDAPWSDLVFDPSASRILKIGEGTQDRRAPGVSLLDGRTGRTLVELVEGGRTTQRVAAFTPRGQVAVGSVDAGRARAQLFQTDGSPVADLDLGPADRIEWIGEPGDAYAIAFLARAGGSAVLRVQWENGAFGEETALKTLPRMPLPFYVGWRGTAGGTDLFVDPDGRLIDFDRETGERRILLAPR